MPTARIERLHDEQTRNPEGLNALRERKKEFADLPASLIPWPYRVPECDEPSHCPKCGRQLIQFVWGDEQRSGPELGYLVTACAGRWQWLAARRPSLLFWMKHWTLTLDRAYRVQVARIRYDPSSGEPMDGPARRD